MKPDILSMCQHGLSYNMCMIHTHELNCHETGIVHRKE